MLDLDTPLTGTDLDEAVNAVAGKIVARRLESPAVLFLEMHRPLSFIASQGLLVALPLLGPLVGSQAIVGFSKLLRDRRNIDRLIERIEQLASERDANTVRKEELLSTDG